MKVAVITTSRADWNSLGMVCKALADQSGQVAVVAIDTHAGLETVQAETGRVIATFGSNIQPGPGQSDDQKMLLVAGLRLASLGAIFEDHPADMALVCGDRHETLQAAFSVAAMGIPLAHLAGGDVSGGSLDERWRHAITKMADIHFPTHAAAAARLVAMGERPDRVFLAGSASIDRLVATPLLTLGETTKALGLHDSRPFILGNWQAGVASDAELPHLLAALEDCALPGVFVGLNPEVAAPAARMMIGRFLKLRKDWRVIDNMPPQLYLSALAHAACLIGNSSSGFYEAPFYGTQVINVGTRQRHRGPVPDCMIQVQAEVYALEAVLRTLTGDPEFKEVRQDLFGDGQAASRIARDILSFQDQPLGPKLFYEHQEGLLP